MTNIDPTTTEPQIPLPENADSPTPEFLTAEEAREMYQELERLFTMSGLTGHSSDRLKTLGTASPKGWRRMSINRHQNLDIQTLEFLKKSGRKYDKVSLQKYGRSISLGPAISVTISHQVGVKDIYNPAKGEENLGFLLAPRVVHQPTITDISGNETGSITPEGLSKFKPDIEGLYTEVREHISQRVGRIAFS